MFLDGTVLNSWWAKRGSAFTKKKELADRFDEFTNIVDTIIKSAYIANNSNLFPFKPNVVDNLLGSDGKGNIENIVESDLKQNLGYQNSGLEYYVYFLSGQREQGLNKDLTPVDMFRIISNSQSNPDFGGTLSWGRWGFPNSNFITNNHPDVIWEFLKLCKDYPIQSISDIYNFIKILCEPSHIVLTHPKILIGEDTDNKYRELVEKKKKSLNSLSPDETKELSKIENDLLTKSNSILEKKFVTKFLWMWANKDKVLHPFSLMAFRNFLKSKFMEDLLKVEIKSALENEKENACKDDHNQFPKNDNNLSELPKLLTDMKFDCFTKVWKHISDAILAKLNLPLNIANLSELSKLISILMVEETDMKNISELLCASKQIILYGAPGTGKTYTAQQVVKEFIKCEKDSEKNPSQKELVDDKQPEFNLEDYNFSKCLSAKSPTQPQIKPYKTGLYEIIQFHPNYTYQDFIGGISPNVSGGQIAYELKEGIFQRFCKVAEKNPDCNFILIIDEINRANLSEVFGELLYALEYRGKSINIPYFGEFTIPEKVYIIGTMNDVDKSLVTFDLALRRRFGFFELAPDLDTLSNMFMFQIEDNNGKKEICSLVEQNCLELYITKCKELNNKIKSKNKDGLALEDSYQIGQAYFKKIENFLDKKKPDQLITPFELEKLWAYHLEPLLKEYLGMSLDGDDIKTKLEGVKKAFIEELK